MVQQARCYIEESRRWVVDTDLEKFFDRVNRDILMSRVAQQVKDERILKLIRGYLQADMLEGGVVTARNEGTPQGGPLSPLLSNILLTDLDRELERRGHRFCRYADDCNIYVRSKRAGDRGTGLNDLIPGNAIKVAGQSGKERGRPPMEASLSGLYRMPAEIQRASESGQQVGTTTQSQA